MNIYQVDAFSNHVFGGNPAAVCPMETWPDDGLLQKIAAENNLAETAYVVPEEDGYRIRWFTPTTEVNLCGHATLAAAYVIFVELDYPHAKIEFQSRSGPLSVTKLQDLLTLNFPTDTLQSVAVPDGLAVALGATPTEAWLGREDYLVLFENESIVANLKPDFKVLMDIKGVRGVIATAEGDSCDFVSRCFFPSVGIDEDPTTGSAHTSLAPFWAPRLGKSQFHARQISSRVGNLWCTLKGDRVEIAGNATLYMRGEIIV